MLQYAASIMNLYISISLDILNIVSNRNLEIIRDMNLYGSLNRLTNVLESGDIWGLQPNTAQTKPYTNINGVMM